MILLPRKKDFELLRAIIDVNHQSQPTSGSICNLELAKVIRGGFTKFMVPRAKHNHPFRRSARGVEPIGNLSNHHNLRGSCVRFKPQVDGVIPCFVKSLPRQLLRGSNSGHGRLLKAVKNQTGNKPRTESNLRRFFKSKDRVSPAHRSLGPPHRGVSPSSDFYLVKRFERSGAFAARRVEMLLHALLGFGFQLLAEELQPLRSVEMFHGPTGTLVPQNPSVEQEIEARPSVRLQQTTVRKNVISVSCRFAAFSWALRAG